MSPKPGQQESVVIGLNAVIVAMSDGVPCFLVTPRQDGRDDALQDGPSYGLPFGPFDPGLHRTLEIGLRMRVEEQTDLSLGYVEQLYTFGDQGRENPTPDLGLPPGSPARIISVGYLALVPASTAARADAQWRGWYSALPWEDHRGGPPPVLERSVAPAAKDWAERGATVGQRSRRRERVAVAFGLDGVEWDEERVLDRYELLYEAGLVEEACRDRDQAWPNDVDRSDFGTPMPSDHRRILATAMSRVRGKIKYRPVVFELMDDAFTLSELQATVEALSGLDLHKPNFRRLVANAGLVEPTGHMATGTGGRPAELYRFRRSVLAERRAPGLRVRGGN
jgi:hypothetical protein